MLALGWQTGYISTSPSPPKIIHFHERLTADVFQAINPAREFRTETFLSHNLWKLGVHGEVLLLLVPLFVPIFGCLLDASVYHSMLFEGEGSTVTDVVDKLDSDRSGELRLD